MSDMQMRKRGRPSKKIKLTVSGNKAPVEEFESRLPKDEFPSGDDLGANEEVLCDTGLENHDDTSYEGILEQPDTMNLQLGSDLNTTTKAAHFLVYKLFSETDVQEDFPFEIDTDLVGFHNFLVEPRPGLCTTDFYNDNYRWNRGTQCSTKKKIFIQVSSHGLKTIRGSPQFAHYIMHWYYSKMEKMSKKVVWLEDIAKSARCSPVLVMYHVNGSVAVVHKRKNPRLYSNVINEASEMLRTNLPSTTVARINSSCNDDPRYQPSIIQTYSMRRKVVEKIRRGSDDMLGTNAVIDPAAFPDEELLSQLISTFGEQREDTVYVNVPLIADKEVKAQAATVCKWINSLCMATPDNVDIVLPHVVCKMRKYLGVLTRRDRSRYQRRATKPKKEDVDLNAVKQEPLEHLEGTPSTSGLNGMPPKRTARKRKPNPRYFDEMEDVIVDVEETGEEMTWQMDAEDYIEVYDTVCDGEIAEEVVVEGTETMVNLAPEDEENEQKTLKA